MLNYNYISKMLKFNSGPFLSALTFSSGNGKTENAPSRTSRALVRSLKCNVSRVLRHAIKIIIIIIIIIGINYCFNKRLWSRRGVLI